MAEYIEREAVLNETQEINHWCGYEYRYENFVPVNAVLDIPVADVAPVRHGQWIPVDEKNDAFDCSECDVMVTRKYDFCPKCGAKMGLEEKV